MLRKLIRHVLGIPQNETKAQREGRRAGCREDVPNPYAPGCRAHAEWQASYDDELDKRRFTQQW